jgi:beta-xylosidase
MTLKYYTKIQKIIFPFIFILSANICLAQQKTDLYLNPIIHQDFSDPDAIRVGEHYFMTASSFNHIPGLPILTSKDLVHWNLCAYALPKLVPEDYFSSVRHGAGVWAPAIRFYKNEFYIYYPDPDFGIYVIKSKKATGPWSKPLLVAGGKGLIDPCPLWDDDGKVYLVHAYAGSRAGIKSIIVVKELNKEGTQVISDGKLVYDGHQVDPTIEGPKFYKRNGYYYIFAPAGGVGTGWQTVLRSRKVYGPYERKVVMVQGKSNINGPHQGAWIQTPEGQDWFLHFQDKGVYGRIVHLQPMVWKNDWPIIGSDDDGDGVGEPVEKYKMPKNLSTLKSDDIGATTWRDEFDSADINKNWQWQANSKTEWYFLNNNKIRLYANVYNDSLGNLYNVPNLLMCKFPFDQFQVTTKMSFNPMLDNEKAGLIVFGYDYAWFGLKKVGDKVVLAYAQCKNASKGVAEEIEVLDTIPSAQSVFLKMEVKEKGQCTFSYSENGIDFKNVKNIFTAKEGKWVGAKVGIFANGIKRNNDCGSADFEWFEIIKK